MPRPARKYNDVAFEESLGDDWGRDLTMVEVPLGKKPLWSLGGVLVAIGLVILGRVIFLNVAFGAYYSARAAANVAQAQATPAPRGIIYDREGDALVKNDAVFAAYLDPHQFLADPTKEAGTLQEIQNIFGMASDTVWSMLQTSEAQEFAAPIALSADLTPTQLVNVQAAAVTYPAIEFKSDFERSYPDGPVYSSVIGYTGYVTQADLAANSNLTSQDFVGRAGIEKYYDSTLEGTPGVKLQFKNAEGQILKMQQQSNPEIGGSINLHH